MKLSAATAETFDHDPQNGHPVLTAPISEFNHQLFAVKSRKKGAGLPTITSLRLWSLLPQFETITPA